jgi:hypothetical protein
MSEATEHITRHNAERERPSHRRCEEVAASQMTRAVRALGQAAALIRVTDKQAWLKEIEETAASAKRARDAMYAEQGPMETLGEGFSESAEHRRHG